MDEQEYTHQIGNNLNEVYAHCVRKLHTVVKCVPLSVSLWASRALASVLSYEGSGRGARWNSVAPGLANRLYCNIKH